MMRKILDLLIKIYLQPFKWSNRFALYAKGKVFDHDEHFICTIDVIRRFYSNNRMPIVDVGAFDGDSTSYLAKHLPQNKVLGFEPNPGPYKKSLRYLDVFPNIEFVNLGLSDRVGEAELFVTNDLVSSSLLKVGESKEFQSRDSVKVNLTTLDTYFENYEGILLLKLDVQGAELKVLSQADKTLAKTRLVLTEMLNANLYQGNCFYHEVDEKLRRHGFKIHTIVSNYNFEGTKYFDVLYVNTSLN